MKVHAVAKVRLDADGRVTGVEWGPVNTETNEWHTEPARQSGRRPRALGADQHVERIVLGRKLDLLQRPLDQALARLVRPEDLEQDCWWADTSH